MQALPPLPRCGPQDGVQAGIIPCSGNSMVGITEGAEAEQLLEVEGRAAAGRSRWVCGGCPEGRQRARHRGARSRRCKGTGAGAKGCCLQREAGGGRT